MEEVVRIAPISGGPGLVAYECPNCVYVTSEIVRPKEAVLAPRVREFGPLLKCPDHPFVEARGIALSAFRDFDDRFGDQNGHSGVTVSYIQTLKRNLVCGS